MALPDLEADGLALALERNGETKNKADADANNWTFKKKDDTPSAWTFDLQRLILKQAQVHYLDPAIKLDMHANVNTLTDNNPQGYGLEFKLDGSYNKAPVSGGGKAGGILSLQDPDAIYPIEADVKLGKNAIAVEGKITKPTAVTAIDLRLSLAGASMANLYPLTGILLPDTPPYATKGHLIGKLNRPGGDQWTYENFTGTVGSSDIAGTLEYLRRQPRPLLRGKLVSEQLRLEDLGPLIKADSNASKANRGAARMQPPDKVLPVEPFDTKSWGVLDADVEFAGRKIIRDTGLPIQDMQARLQLTDSVLSLMPLNFGVAGGNMTSNIMLDGKGESDQGRNKNGCAAFEDQAIIPEPEIDAGQLWRSQRRCFLIGYGQFDRVAAGVIQRRNENRCQPRIGQQIHSGSGGIESGQCGIRQNIRRQASGNELPGRRFCGDRWRDAHPLVRDGHHRCGGQRQRRYQSGQGIAGAGCAAEEQGTARHFLAHALVYARHLQKSRRRFI